MQRVESGENQSTTVLLSKLEAPLEGHFRYVDLKPRPRVTVTLEASVHRLCLVAGDPALEYVLRNGVRPLRPMQWRKPNTRTLRRETSRAGGMLVRHIQRNEKARVRVEAQ